jgi:UTP--glucose-1-phosphate uridylyltransferase
MIGVCTATEGSVVAVVDVPRDEVSSYGVIEPAGDLSDDGVIPVRNLVEKPSAQEAPSTFILTGRYVLTADAWDEIDALTPGAGGELQLTDALRAQAARSPFHAVVAGETRLDTGTPLGFLTASVELGLRDPELGQPLRAYLAHLTSTA